MVQLRILTGKSAGTVQVIQRFPCLIGRGAEADLRLEEPGVWERHIQLAFVPGAGISASVLPGALATLNGQALNQEVLHNGDLLQLGSAKLQFWLGQTRQRGLRLRESLTWIGLGLLCLGQIALIYRLLR